MSEGLTSIPSEVSKVNYYNPLMGTMPHRIIYEVGTLAVNGWAVTVGTARRGLVGAAARPGPSSLYQT